MEQMLTIRLPKKVRKEMKEVSKEFGFADEREFVRDAIEKMVSDLKKASFFQSTDLIKKRLKAKK